MFKKHVQKNYKLALIHANNGLNIVINPIFKIELLKLTSDIYKAMNNDSKSLEYYMSYTKMKDSIFTKEKHLQIEQLGIIYETEKKEQKIATLSKEK